MTNGNSAALDALKRAEQFIVNGIEFGYIRMPDAPDPALETLPAIRSAIAAMSVCADGGELRDFQRELATYFEDVGDPHGAIMIRNFADLSRADGGKGEAVQNVMNIPLDAAAAMADYTPQAECAPLTDGELIAISNALQGTGYAYIADKLRAILAANKEGA